MIPPIATAIVVDDAVTTFESPMYRPEAAFGNDVGHQRPVDGEEGALRGAEDGRADRGDVDVRRQRR